MEEGLQERQSYRSLLVQTWQKAQDDFDKAILSLSGGALGISFVFVKNIAGIGPVGSIVVLFLAWCSLGLSSTSTLISFFVSKNALGREIKAVDAEIEGKTAVDLSLGAKRLDRYTSGLNIAAIVLFLVGIILMAFFAANNMEAIVHGDKK